MPDSLFATLLHWAPALLRGLSVNVGISLLAVGLGTVAGLAVGALRLSPLDDVLSTATHFVLRTYKRDGVMYADESKDERGYNFL